MKPKTLLDRPLFSNTYGDPTTAEYAVGYFEAKGLRVVRADLKITCYPRCIQQAL